MRIIDTKEDIYKIAKNPQCPADKILQLLVNSTIVDINDVDKFLKLWIDINKKMHEWGNAGYAHNYKKAIKQFML